MTDPYDTATRAANNGQGRVPPHNLEAEAAVLGAMALKKDACAVAVEQLRPEDFHNPANAILFEIMADLHHAGELPDAVSVNSVLMSTGQAKKVGQLTLTDYIHAVPATGNIGRYARVVKGHSDLRKAIVAAGQIIEKAHNLTDPAKLATEMLAAAQALVDSTNRQLNIYTMEQLVSEHLDALEERGSDKPPGLMTGLRALDEHTGGLRDGEMVTVIAEPGVGKSALVGNIARLVSATGTHVLGASVEMARLELTDRMMAAEASIPLSLLRRGAIGEAGWDKVYGASTRLLENAGLFIIDDPDVTLDQIDAAIRRTQAKLFVVDYAQILKAPEGAGTREREVAAISSGLKRMARRHGIPGIVLSAINRNVAGRADQRPVRSDIRESGQLEYDSNEIWGLYRDELVNTETSEPGIMEVIVLKSRNSKAGTVKLRYDPDTQLITDVPSPGATR